MSHAAWVDGPVGRNRLLDGNPSRCACGREGKEELDLWAGHPRADQGPKSLGRRVLLHLGQCGSLHPGAIIFKNKNR